MHGLSGDDGERSTPSLAGTGVFVPAAEDSTTTAHAGDDGALARLLAGAASPGWGGESRSASPLPGGAPPPPVGPFDYSRERRFTALLAEAGGAAGVLQADALEDVVGGAAGRPVLWLDVRDPTRDDLARIAQMHALHPLTVEDVETQDGREKCEVFPAYVFLCVQTVDHGVLAANHPARAAAEKGRCAHDATPSRTIYAALFSRLLLTFHYGALPHVGRVLQRLRREAGAAAPGADWALYALLDDVVDEFAAPLLEMQAEVDAVDEMVLLLTHRELPDVMRRIGRGRRRATHLVRLLRPKTGVLRMLTGSRVVPAYLRPGTLVYLRDVGDHVLGALSALEEYAETLNRSHANYLAHISIELNEASNDLNVVMKQISAIAVFFLPVSVVAGLWGMNVPVPFQAGVGPGQLLPFFGLLALCVVLVLLFWAYTRYRRWW